MIINTISKLLFSHEEFHDGGLESLIFIFKYYKGNESVVYLNKLIDNLYDTKNSFEKLEFVATKYGFLAVVCNEVDAITIKEYNQPVIINISNKDNHNSFVVICEYNETDGFKIFDSKNGYYYVSIVGLQSIWKDKKCLAISNA